MFSDILYIIWIGIPCVFVLWALYARLEQASKSTVKQEPGQYLRQGGFLALCVAITIALDRFVIPSLADNLPEMLPLPMFRILLLPFVLLIMAKLVGGSKKPQIKQGRGNTAGRKRRP